MSIGQGEGENKALIAIDQAINHPLLDNTSLDNAAGILINFTSGEDLSLIEIEAAVNYLQQKAGSQVEIVLGVIHDERLYDRVEVILVVTGLGAPTLEDTMSNFAHLPINSELDQTIDQPDQQALSDIVDHQHTTEQ